MRVQDAERRKIARELHDSIGQYLIALKLNLTHIEGAPAAEGANTLRDSLQLLDQCISETRTISYLLHPPLLDEIGLSPATKLYADGFAQRSGIEVGLAIDEKLGRYSQDTELAAFRAIQESLTNAHRHSETQRVEISVREEGGQLLTCIRDYGRGFTAQQLSDAQGGRSRSVGITGLRERVIALGGSITIEPAAPGTAITVALPAAARI